MSDTTFVNGTTVIDATWLNSINDNIYDVADATSGTVARTLQNKMTELVSIRDFGAVGDGVTDDSAAINTAIETVSAAGGGVVYMPAGTYLCDDEQILLLSNVHLKGAGEGITTILRSAAGDTSVILSGVGTYNDLQYNISAPLDLGAREVTFTGTHTFEVNEPIWIIGQRDSLTRDDAGDEWTLGYATPDTSGCLFGEMNVVQDVVSTTEIKLAVGVVFPNYRHNADDETSSQARSATSFRKVSWIRNVQISDFTVEIERSVITPIRFDYAYDCRAFNITFKLGLHDSNSLFFHTSFLCTGFNLTAIHTPRDYTDLEKVPNIDFKSVSSHGIVFQKCRSFHGTQPFDFTYTGGRTPSLFCRMTECEVYAARVSGMTTHPGCYAIQITNNQFTACRQGGVIRSRKTIFNNNVCSGDEAIATTKAAAITDRLFYGVGLYEGWARDCIVSGNSITGFNVGMMINDAPNEDESFDYVGAVLTNNTITHCYFGFMRDTVFEHQVLTAISIVNNIFSWCYQPIYVEKYTAAVKIHGNDFTNIKGTTLSVVEFDNDCPFADVQFNRFMDIGASNTGVEIATPTGTWTGYTITAADLVRNNSFIGTFSAKYSVNNTYVKSVTSYDAGARGEGGVVLTDGITAPTVSSGRAQIYVDTADGDLKIMFGDGTVKVLSADT
jgi:hypothetical protein